MHTVLHSAAETMTWLASILRTFALVCTVSIISVPPAGCYRSGALRESCEQMQVEHFNPLTETLATAQPCISCPYVLSVEAMVNSGTRTRTGEVGSVDTYQCGQDYECECKSFHYSVCDC